MGDIIIIGAGGFGREVALIASESFNVVGFVDDFKISTKSKKPILGKIDYLLSIDKPISVCIAIADPMAKKNIYEKIKKNAMLSFPNIISQTAVIKEGTKIGVGNIICDNVVVTCDTTIGNFVAIDVLCSIGHDAIIDDYCTLYPLVSVSGNTHLFESVQMGTNSTIIQGINIGCNTFVGAGACVISNMPDNVVAVGVPCKVIKNKE